MIVKRPKIFHLVFYNQQQSNHRVLKLFPFIRLHFFFLFFGLFGRIVCVFVCYILWCCFRMCFFFRSTLRSFGFGHFVKNLNNSYASFASLIQTRIIFLDILSGVVVVVAIAVIEFSSLWHAAWKFVILFIFFVYAIAFYDIHASKFSCVLAVYICFYALTTALIQSIHI